MNKRRRRLLAGVVLAGLAVFGFVAWFGDLRVPGPGLPASMEFVAEPYLQLGPGLASADRLDLLWLAHDRDAAWSVETRAAASASWVPAEPPSVRRIAVEGVEPHRICRAVLAGLTPGEEFVYRVLRDGAAVFEATARAPRPPGRPHRFAAFGDCGAGTSEQRAIAYEAWRARPDYVVIPGDIVYMKGRIAEYLARFFPVYNEPYPSRRRGGPLLRSVPFVAAPGNHDLVWRDLDQYPDALAYFLYWDQPLNGPEAASDPARLPAVTGSEARRQAFLDAAGSAYPRMANFSYDYGGVHWVVLDANTYADLGGEAVRSWLARDLAAARRADWRLVTLHQPPFHSSQAHAEEQQSRRLVDLFEQGKVDLVIAGHVHNYQRTYPMKFVADPPRGGSLVPGRWVLDRAYDGQTRTQPDGIIYLVTGGGGARLYDSRQHGDPASWREYTARFVADRHSLTIVDVAPHRLTVRQVSDRGAEIDRFVITRDEKGAD